MNEVNEIAKTINRLVARHMIDAAIREVARLGFEMRDADGRVAGYTLAAVTPEVVPVDPGAAHKVVSVSPRGDVPDIAHVSVPVSPEAVPMDPDAPNLDVDGKRMAIYYCTGCGKNPVSGKSRSGLCGPCAIRKGIAAKKARDAASAGAAAKKA